ncbi:MAG: alcohol dehydrogenase catalytic domain-containing protein [Planctomycetes bacterium]|nr:alcohol dehydrogenase catalytic domain-containing protein [Planctomycetota bacterium]
MKAVYLTGLSRMELRNAPRPQLSRPDDVLIKVAIVGVCGSDMHYYTAGRIGNNKVTYPFILGHEFAGTIEEVGPEAKGIEVGMRVAIDPLVACGKCDQCLGGRKHTCRNQQFVGSANQIPGALREYIVLPGECCFEIPDDVTMAQAALTEPFSIGLHAQHQGGDPAGASAAIIGSGPIGLSVLMALKNTGIGATFMTDLLDYRLDLARKCGADWTGNPDKQDVVADIIGIKPNGMDLAFECVGKQETLDHCVKVLKPGGLLVIVGIPEFDRISFSIDELRRKELRIHNVRRQNQCIAPAIEMVAGGAVDLDVLISHEFQLEESQKAFDLVANYQDNVVKAMIKVSNET